MLKPKLKTRSTGSCTVYEGTNGYWNRISFGKASREVYLKLLEGKATSEEYVASVRQQISDERQAFRMQGRPARSAIGRYFLRRSMRRTKDAVPKTTQG